MRLIYFTKTGFKFNPILDNPIFEFIVDIFIPRNKPKKRKQKEVMKNAYTNYRHL
jgi:hypothetical protein